MVFDIEIYFLSSKFSLLFASVRLEDCLECEWGESVPLSLVKFGLKFHPNGKNKKKSWLDKVVI